jgi:hypothetical protein
MKLPLDVLEETEQKHGQTPSGAESEVNAKSESAFQSAFVYCVVTVTVSGVWKAGELTPLQL